jgi:hypothetical protein
MKGTPQVPQCGFSRAVIQVLDLHGVPPEKMNTYDVLEDSELRSGIKEFSYVLCKLITDGLTHTTCVGNGLQFPNYMSILNLSEDATSSLGVSRALKLYQ